MDGIIAYLYIETLLLSIFTIWFLCRVKKRWIRWEKIVPDMREFVKRNEKRKGSVSGAFYLIYLFSLFRAPHSNTRASIGAREEQVSRPALFFCKTRNRPLFYFMLGTVSTLIRY